MSSSTSPEPTHIAESETDAEMKRYGIIQVPAHFYEFGGYRYTNVKDAIAEARRHPETGGRV